MIEQPGEASDSLLKIREGYFRGSFEPRSRDELARSQSVLSSVDTTPQKKRIHGHDLLRCDRLLITQDKRIRNDGSNNQQSDRENQV
ncbi:hypothetical protein TNCT_391241 [Trichonephila clavata]|uniref:Uncharacterized protein n=1 Tax=Trichonephila clavata TaxID=2740835 RepID=A0A8X6LK01_TRICU|nr:hypothetical protein TNCT_391241 [Trichonephila clavata]